jgi:hypothetical protein
MNTNKNFQSSSIADILWNIGKEVESLAESPASEVSNNIKNTIRTQINENPYGTLAAAFGIGFGIGALKSSHVKSAVIEIGRLFGLRALSHLNSQQQQGAPYEQHH